MKRRLLSILLVLVMVSSMTMGVFAAPVTSTVDNGDGTTTTTTTDSTTTSTENGGTITVEWIMTQTEGTAADPSTKDGVTVDFDETVTDTSETDKEGTEIATEHVEEGTETKTWEEEDDGNEAGQPEVEVELKENTTTSGIGTTETTTGDDDKTDGEWDYTETTVEEREVTVQGGSFEETVEGETDVDMIPVQPENYNKVNIRPDSIGPSDAVSAYYDKVEVTDEDGNTEVRYMARFVRDDSDMPDFLKESGLYTKVETENEDGETVVTWKPNAAKGKKDYADWNWDFMFAERGEYSNAGQAVAQNRYNDNAHFVLYDENGNRFYAYCMDAVKFTSPGQTYILENLDDTTYFKDPSYKEHIRGIVENGYWGQEDGESSLAALRDQMKTALQDGWRPVIEYKDGGDGKYHLYDSNTEEGMAAILRMIDDANEGDFLTATQGAIWSFGRYDGVFYGFNPFRNNDPTATKGEDGKVLKDENGHYMLKDGGAEARMTLLWEYMKTLTSTKSETTILDQTSFLDKEKGLSITVGDKIVEGDNPAATDSDLYNVDVNFQLVMTPGVKDDLIVKLVDSEGNVIRKARVAGDSSNDGDDFSILHNNGGGSYSFTGLALRENTDIVFDLQLEGVQQLEKGVYIYRATTGYDKNQTLVGLAEGSREVNVSTAFSFQFNVNEDDKAKQFHDWRRAENWSADPVDPPVDPQDPPQNPPVEELPDPEVPLEELPEEAVPMDDLTEILDEEVPLANVPMTGDSSLLFIGMSILSGTGLAGMALTKKREDEE